MDPDSNPACHFYADPDPNPACHFAADPDQNPTFHFDAVPDLDPDRGPSFQLNAQNLEKVQVGYFSIHFGLSSAN